MDGKLLGVVNEDVELEAQRHHERVLGEEEGGLRTRPVGSRARFSQQGNRKKMSNSTDPDAAVAIQLS